MTFGQLGLMALGKVSNAQVRLGEAFVVVANGTDRDFLKAQASLYQKENEARAVGRSENNVPFHKRYHLDPDQLEPGENAKHRSEALGFWLRRHLDGTFDHFGRLMSRLLQKYDPEILKPGGAANR